MVDGDVDIQPSTLRCVQCEYDLTGAIVGGRCPECGTLVSDSIAALIPKNQLLLPPNNAAQSALALGIASIVCLPLLGILAVILGIIARRQIARENYRSSARIQADFGIVIGFLTTAFWTLVVLSDL